MCGEIHTRKNSPENGAGGGRGGSYAKTHPVDVETKKENPSKKNRTTMGRAGGLGALPRIKAYGGGGFPGF